MSARQGVLLGMEAYFRPQWKPRPGLLARFQNYFQGFAAYNRAIYCRRKHIADKLRVSLRTVDRYLAYLTSTGWLETLKRTARTAIRAVKKVFAPQSSGEPTGESIEVEPEVSQNHQTQNAFYAPSLSDEPDEGGARETPKVGGKPLPLGYSEAFANYIGIFYAAGKAMNAHDVMRAHAAWIGVGPENWSPATKHALEQCQRTRHAQFVPLPVNHLLDRGWERVAPLRTLPYIDTTVSRQDANQAEAARRFGAEMTMAPPAADDFSPAARRYRQRAARRTA